MKNKNLNLYTERSVLENAMRVIELLEELEKRIKCSLKQIYTPSYFYTRKDIEEKIETQEKVKARLIKYYKKLKNIHYEKTF